MGAADDAADRKADFLRLSHDIELLNLAVDILVLCAPPKIANDMGVRQVTGAAFLPSMKVLHWLERQGLLLRLTDNGFYQAAPGAFDELIYRLAHHGETSPGWVDHAVPPLDPFVAERAQARNKLVGALRSAGYYTDPNNSERRLRVV